MTINVDENAGFCWGVVQTVEKVEGSLLENDGRQVNILGEIIHNPQETKRLAEKGLNTIEVSDLDSLPANSKVIIRAHGEPPATYKKLIEKKIDYVDATCPLVQNLQKKVYKQYQEGRQIIIYGKYSHPEIIGLRGVCENNCIVIQSKAEADENIDFTRESSIFSQTTMNEDDFNRVIGYLKDKFPEDKLLINNSVCRFVISRESKLKTFAKDNEIILFVAGRNSSNGKVLFNICQSANPNIHFIESIEEISGEWFEGVSSVGITGATSTPQWYLNEVKDYIVSNY